MRAGDPEHGCIDRDLVPFQNIPCFHFDIGEFVVANEVFSCYSDLVVFVFFSGRECG